MVEFRKLFLQYIIIAINYAMIIVIHLKVLKFKYVNNYMLIYVKILKSSDCLDIILVDTYMPALCTL